MVHNAEAESPRIFVQNEHDTDYSDPIVPETAIVDAIRERTDEHLKALGNATVSSKPIVLRAEYAYCANITIIDTPGLIGTARHGESNTAPDDIKKMVKELIRPQNRTILFLQQSTVEWNSNGWKPVVEEVDPDYKRTVFVVSKFDNRSVHSKVMLGKLARALIDRYVRRMKEFETRYEVDKYLSASGYLPKNVKPFFVSLPKERTVQLSHTAASFREAVATTDAEVIHHLRNNVDGGFDEEAYGDRIGFANLRSYLEKELQRHYRAAMPRLLSVLDERVQQAQKELNEANDELQKVTDVVYLRRTAMQWAMNVFAEVRPLLDGASDPDPTEHGQTTFEERSSSGISDWPGVSSESATPDAADLRLHGGAAFERLISEFTAAALALEFPQTSKAKITNILYCRRKPSQETLNEVADDIARDAARTSLKPLLETVCQRIAHVLHSVLDLAILRVGGKEACVDEPQPMFVEALKKAHNRFVHNRAENCEQLVKKHLDNATSEFAFSVTQVSEEKIQARESHKDASEAHAADDRGRGGTGTPLAQRKNVQAETVPETPAHMQGRFLGYDEDDDVIQGATQRDDAEADEDSSRKAPRMDKVTFQRTAGDGTGEGSAQFSQRSETHARVIAAAEILFDLIRQRIASEVVPTALRNAFLPACRTELVPMVSTELFACADETFLNAYSQPGMKAQLERRHSEAKARFEKLQAMQEDFSDTASRLA